MAPSEIFAPGMLDGRVALVTGGGTGLGRAAAAELRACGAEVVISGRRREVLDEAAAELGAHAVAGDVREVVDAERMVRFALERCGRLDVLVNNAGGQYFVPAEAIEPKGWRAVTRLNLGGTELMSRTAAELAFRPQGGGTIVNVTLSPHQGLAGMTHSSAARAAVEGLTRALAREWRDDGIAVLAVAAGHFDTQSIRKYPEPVWKAAARTVPLQRLGREEEHAWLVALAACPLARALSGSVVTLDGGRDNWFGPWPPPALTEDGGEVPTEARRPPAPR
jgi:citronellol/citronellal dehydrogenase